jgi:outer membrane receptor protein involved in Fe transport
MNNLKGHLAATVGLTLAGAAFGPKAAAQDEAAVQLEEIVVTASRREEALQNVALAVTVLDVGKFADAGLTGLTDILTYVPGVSVIDSGRPFFNSVYVRGINSVLAAGVVSYVDEIPFGSSTVYTSPTPLDGTLLDVDTLDVLKGPQGTLYGASSLGGIMKFNTREASLDEWTGNVSSNLSSTKRGGLNQLHRLNLNGPLVGETLGLSLTGFWQDKTGYIDNVTIPRNEWDDYEYYGGSGSLRWAASDRLEVTVQGLYQNSTLEGAATVQANHAQDQLMPGIGAAEPWFGRYQTGQADINPSEYEASVLGLNVDYEFDFGTLTYVGSTQEMTFVQTMDLTVPFAEFADLFFPANAPHTQALFVGDLGFDKITQELRLTSDSGQQFEWIVGAYYSDEDGHNIQRLDTTPAEPDFFFVNFPSNYKERSLFATGTWYFTQDFDASIGVRYADYSNDVELAAVGPLLAPLPFSEIDDEVTNFLFNLRYRSGDNISWYGRVASGYRPGGANFLLLDPMGNPLTNPFIEPDSLWSYEVGVKGSSQDGRLGYDLNVFYIDWKDYIVNVTVGGVNVAGNAERAVSQGGEASLTFAASESLTVRANLSYTNAELAADEPDLGGRDGDQLPSSPELQGLLDFEYRFDLFNLPAYVGAAWRYKDSMPVGFDGFTDSMGVFHPPSAPRVILDSYDLVDLRGGFVAGPVDVGLYVTNALDEWAWANFAPTFAGASNGTPTRPRTVGAVVRWNFQ